MKRIDRPQSSATRFRVLLISVSLLISSLGLSLGSIQIAHAENCEIYMGYIGIALGKGDTGAAARWQQEYKNCNSRNANAIRVDAGYETRLDCSLSRRYFIDALTSGNIEKAYGWAQRNDECEAYNRRVDNRAREAAAKAAAARAAAIPTQTIKPAATPTPTPTARVTVTPTPTPTPTLLSPLDLWRPRGLAEVGNTISFAGQNPFTDYDTVTYKWVRTKGKTDIPIPGANQSSYTIQNEDIGWGIYCDILYKKPGTSGQSHYIISYGIPTPTPTARVTVTPTPTPTPTARVTVTPTPTPTPTA